MLLHPATPPVGELLRAWDFRLDAALVLGTAALLYVVGWWRLRRRARRQLATGWRLASYLGGITLLVLALMSPIDGLVGYLFFIHMIQHLLMAMLAPPLLWLGSPLPIGLWGLPRPLRLSADRLLGREAAFRRALRWATPPFVVRLVFIVGIWGWHDPNAYNAALRIAWLHDLEHLTFFAVGMLFWWLVTGAAPRVHGHVTPAARLFSLLFAFFTNIGPSVAIAMSDRLIYTYYADAPRLWGISPLEDQRISGLIMWIPGGMMYALAAVVLIMRHAAGGLQPEARKRSLPAPPHESPASLA